ncbi:hypothetical protein [Bacillus sp. PS06]|uniref:hypothetical protein n=1 Tax=Bacillus sp. PS06 TaxID=2764176 RepID=UPI00177BCDC6|nr:hypothetical protein [Bacillus sp. PS06]MBD8069517.1 hypothetical protein [Bacillus sp. PS06]
MNKFGTLSILTALVCVLVFFILRGPNADLLLCVGILGSLSILGVIFAIVSKRWVAGIIGVLLNGTVLVFVFFLFLAWGIAG